MKKRLSLPVLVLVAVVALVLGTVGTAVAGPGLTKGKVKTIAAKVVKKAAPGLSVAHATTADTATSATTATTAATATNALNLGGQPAAAYTNPYFTVGVAQATAVSSFTKTLPAVPAGTYLATINMTAQMNSAAYLTCVLSQGGTILLPAAASFDNGLYATINASRVVTVSGALTLLCQGGATFTSPTGFGYPANSITFTKVGAGTSLGTATRPGTPTERPGGPTG
jgi:hypothetical protein